jgi:hypothetical protein
MNTLELTGLRGHHPLGFLAACGVLRLCPKAKLGWVYQENSHYYTAKLDLSQLGSGDEEKSKMFLLELLIRKTRRLSRTLPWWREYKHIKMPASDFHKVASGYIDQGNFNDSLAFFPCLASDIVVDEKRKVTPTLFDCTSGRQGLLKSLAELMISLGKVPKKQRRADQKTTSPREAFEEAVFGPWQYRDNQHSLGWDPQTQRVHALLRIDPSIGRDTEGVPGVRAAVFLASQAIPFFPCFAFGGRLRTTAFHKDQGDDWFTWPIWRTPISLYTLRSLLAHRPDREELERRGVETFYRCRRVGTGGPNGNYYVFSNAEEWL